jgi:hypothetical protein
MTEPADNCLTNLRTSERKSFSGSQPCQSVKVFRFLLHRALHSRALFYLIYFAATYNESDIFYTNITGILGIAVTASTCYR